VQLGVRGVLDRVHDRAAALAVRLLVVAERRLQGTLDLVVTSTT
jgi:hypothetical protein